MLSSEVEKLNINQWSPDDRPREKLLNKGAESLSDAELLAILIGSGSTSESAVELMKRILGDCNNNLNTLGKRSVGELMGYKGIGEAKAITILAAAELGKRRSLSASEQRPDLGTPKAVYELMHPRMQDLDVEEAWVVLMNQHFRLIKTLRISHGGFSETAVDVRVIMREAVLAGATVLALCHNHPSNQAVPSKQDDELTNRIHKACDLMRIYFLDHLIVCDGTYYSYRDDGRL